MSVNIISGTDTTIPLCKKRNCLESLKYFRKGTGGLEWENISYFAFG